MAVSNVRRNSKEWYALRPSSYVRRYCHWELVDEAEGTYHLLVKADYPALATGVGNRPNGDYATNDIFVRASPGSDYWEYLGRRDDTLVM